jgi:S1-C subfamily serine protease
MDGMTPASAGSAADAALAAASSSTSNPTATSDDDAYARPDGVFGGFEPQPPVVPYSPPPPTGSPQEQAVFGRPPGAGEYAPPPADRVAPRHVPSAPAPPGAQFAFGRTPGGAGGFDPAPGTRISPSDGQPESPWWKADAHRDPWRDPRSPAWLGRPAIFVAGQPEQLDPAADDEQDADAVVAIEDEELPEAGTTTRRGRFGLSALLLSLVIALLAGAIGGGVGYYLDDRAHNVLHDADINIAKVGTAANRPPGSVADIAQRLEPAVVSIAVHTSSVDGIGSGVVIDKSGYILTNNHVVSADADGGGTLTVTFNDKSTVPAKIVGRDTLTDLAVLKVATSSLTVASLGDSSKLAVGDPVIAIGSPLGLTGTVTSGIVSALNRPVHVSGDDTDTNAVIDAIQTDAAINPGNSGGPLVDAQGAVIGINSAIASLPSTGDGQPGSIGLGFAIPIDTARTIAQELIRTGKAVHASIGLSTRAVTDGSREGAYIVQVSPGGPGAKAGLKAGDVVTLADGTLITSGDELTVVVQEHAPGDTISLKYFRGSTELTTTVTLGSA